MLFSFNVGSSAIGIRCRRSAISLSMDAYWVTALICALSERLRMGSHVLVYCIGFRKRLVFCRRKTNSHLCRVASFLWSPPQTTLLLWPPLLRLALTVVAALAAEPARSAVELLPLNNGTGLSITVNGDAGFCLGGRGGVPATAVVSLSTRRGTDELGRG